MKDNRFECKDNIIKDTLTGTLLTEPCTFLNLLDKSNTHLNRLILDIIEFIKVNDGVTREEFAEWWNRRVGE